MKLKEPIRYIPSLPCYDGEEYVDRSFHKKKILKWLKREEFEIDLYPVEQQDGVLALIRQLKKAIKNTEKN